MHCLAPHFLLLPLPTASPHALPKTQAPPVSLLLPSRAAPLHLASARSPSRATASVSDDDEDDEVEEEEDDEDEVGTRDVDDDDYDEYEEGDEADDEEEEDESGGDDEEETVAMENEREDTAARRRESEEYKSRRVDKLVTEVREFGEDIIDYNELAGIYDFPIDKFQRLAIQAFLRGSSVVVSAPTSSGKTLIAEAAAVATIARGRRLFYTTPLKALSNQKFRDFRNTFGDHNVGLLTGDSAINKDAQILIMTTEILRNMLYQSVGMTTSEGRLFQVDVIVLDEVHYLSDISRGTVWEETVIYCPKEVQLICLSATVANPDELAGWISKIHSKTELVTSTKRPVPLTWHFSKKFVLLPLLDGKGKKMNRSPHCSSWHHIYQSILKYNVQGSPGATVKLLPCDREVMGSSPGRLEPTQGKAVYKRPKLVGSFSGPYASGSYML